MLSVKNLTISYGGPEPVLEGASLTVADGQLSDEWRDTERR